MEMWPFSQLIWSLLYCSLVEPINRQLFYFKRCVVENQCSHNLLIHVIIKGLLCSVWKSVYLSVEGCWLFDAVGQAALTLPYAGGGGSLQLLLIYKSIWVRHQIVYVVCVCVCVCWGGAYDPSVPVFPTMQHGGSDWIKAHLLNLSWHSWQLAPSQFYKEQTAHTRQLNTHLLINQLLFLDLSCAACEAFQYRQVFSYSASTAMNGKSGTEGKTHVNYYFWWCFIEFLFF